MERIDRDTWRTDNGDEVRTRGLRLTVEFGERTKAEVLCAVEAVSAENAKLRELVQCMYAYYVSGTLSDCELCDWMLDCESHPALSCKHGDHYDRSEFVNSMFEGRMRELGIGAD